MAKPVPGSSIALPADHAEPLAAIEDMIATLKDLRRRTGDRALLGAYQAAIDRLDALAYRLTETGSAPAPAPPKPAIGCRALVAAARVAARPRCGRAPAEAAMMDRRR